MHIAVCLLGFLGGCLDAESPSLKSIDWSVTAWEGPVFGMAQGPVIETPPVCPILPTGHRFTNQPTLRNSCLVMFVTAMCGRTACRPSEQQKPNSEDRTAVRSMK